MQTLRGKRFVATRIELVSSEETSMAADNASAWFDGSSMVGSQVLGGAQVFCDWTIQADGFLRFLIVDKGLRQVQSGRLVQRLYEIETYRMMTLLALPVAREMSRSLDELELSLASLMRSMDERQCRQHDAALLAQLTHLAARTAILADAGSRFSAARAYEDLVKARIRELCEEPIEGMPTIAEFLERAASARPWQRAKPSGYGMSR
ncbi:putative membrane-anchored protein [Paraburkholderia sp. UCT70]